MLLCPCLQIPGDDVKAEHLQVNQESIDEVSEETEQQVNEYVYGNAMYIFQQLSMPGGNEIVKTLPPVQ